MSVITTPKMLTVRCDGRTPHYRAARDVSKLGVDHAK